MGLLYHRNFLHGLIDLFHDRKPPLDPPHSMPIPYLIVSLVPI